MPAKQAEKEPAPVERYLEAIDHAILYRYPHVIGPPGLAAAALGAAAVVHNWVSPTGQLVFAVFLGVLLLLGLDSASQQPGGLERAYAVCCWLGGVAWTGAAAWWGTGFQWRGWPVIQLGLALLLVLAWPPWFKHRRIRRMVDVAKEISAFGDGEAVGLKGVTLSKAGATADEHGWVAPVLVNIPGAYTLDMLQKAIPRIAARMGCEPYSLNFERVKGDKEGKYRLRRDYGTRDPEGMHFEVPAAPTSVRRPFPVGLLADQKTPMQIEVWRKGHGGVDSIVAGQKGYGKTTAYKRIGIHTVASKDGLLWIGDMKPGSPDYEDLAAGCHAYARTAEDIDVMIEALHLLCEVRGRNKRSDRKVIVVLLDETSLYFARSLVGAANRQALAAAARLDQERQTRWAKLAAISRAFDIALYAATQRCEPATIGGDNARAALLAGQVVGFYSPKQRDSALISADGKLTMHTLPRNRKGECWMSNHIHGDPVRGRWHMVTDEQVREVVARFTALEKDLHPDELAALRQLGERWERLRRGDSRVELRVVADDEGVDEEPEEGVNHAAFEPEIRATSPQESRQMVWDALARLGRPATAAELAPLVRRGMSLVRARLAELEAVGCVSRRGYNRWTTWEAVRNPALLSSTPSNDTPAGDSRRPPAPAPADQ